MAMSEDDIRQRMQVSATLLQVSGMFALAGQALEGAIEPQLFSDKERSALKACTEALKAGAADKTQEQLDVLRKSRDFLEKTHQELVEIRRNSEKSEGAVLL